MVICTFDSKTKLFKENHSSWNVGRLGDILQSIRDNLRIESKGVNRSSLIIGQTGAAFPIHTEDWHLPAINYLHAGAPKIWYAIAQKDHDRFRDLLLKDLRKSKDFDPDCPNYLAHKSTIVSPKWLKKNNINYTRVVQYPMTYVVVAPGVFHFGYNMGPNISEAVNFLTDINSWKEWGRKWQFCDCG